MVAKTHQLKSLGHNLISISLLVGHSLKLWESYSTLQKVEANMKSMNCIKKKKSQMRINFTEPQ